MTTPDRQAEASDLGRFEPSAYDLGITNETEAAWQDGPVPYSLTRAASAALDDPTERLAQRCGFPDAAVMASAIAFLDGLEAEYSGEPAPEADSEAEPEIEP